ncbi:MAG: transglycosylase SLT domain-containing protein, partial [Alphaproteobacteria bacterium]|nr:transglycosylase SLT domain-containing protein [Alphaproteobacteria bacterium]
MAEATQATANARAQVVAAVQNAAARTGADFDYLLGTDMRESGLEPQAKSGTSSASGLYQFVEQTWLGLVKKYGAEYGLGAAANAISQGRDGRYRADSQSDRQAILALR